MPEALRREPAADAREVRSADVPSMTARLAEIRHPDLRASLPTEPAMSASLHAQSDEPQATFAEPETPMARIASVEVRVERAAPLIAEPAPEVIEEVSLEAPEFDTRTEREGEGRDLTALVSAATVEQVSRSFSELAAAFDGTERRSLDEMAEEMLRPMLKDWLDANLPAIVEAQVRKEVERIARNAG